MKKVFILISMLFSLVACGPKEDIKDNDDSKPGETPSTNLNVSFDEFFNPNSKIEIEISFKNNVLKSLATYGTSGDFSKEEMYHPCDVKVIVNGKTSTYNEVGARMKGNTSRNDSFIDDNGKFTNKTELCHFKLAFDKAFTKASTNDYYSNTYTEEEKAARDKRTCATLKKIDLKWNRTYDSSFTKELYALNAFRNEGVFAQHGNLVNVTIKTENDSVTIPYLAYETVDKSFIKRNFEGTKGDLYKCTYTDRGPADLASSIENKFGVETDGFNPSYCLKTNEDTSNCEAIKIFIDKTAVRNISAEEIKSDIDTSLDVDNFLKFAAMSWVVGSPDDYRNNYNNYYMYFSSKNNKAYFVPYDNDRVFGILRDWAIDTSKQTPTSDRLSKTATSEGCGSPLVRRLLVSGSNSRPIIEEYQNTYLKYCKEYANKYLNPNSFKEFSKKFTYSNKVYDDSGNNMSFETYSINKLSTLN